MVISEETKQEAALLIEKNFSSEAAGPLFSRIFGYLRMIALPTLEERTTGQDLALWKTLNEQFELDFIFGEVFAEVFEPISTQENILSDVLPPTFLDRIRDIFENQLGQHPDILSIVAFVRKFVPEEVDKQVRKLKPNELFGAPILVEVMRFIKEHIKKVQADPLLASCVTPYSIAAGHLRSLTEPKYQNSYHQKIALAVIQEEEHKEEPSPHEVEQLAGELLIRMRAAEKKINPQGASQEEIFNLTSEDGMFSWDARAAQFLERIGETGKEFAKKLRDKSRERWTAFTNAQNEEEKRQARSLVWSLCWADMNDNITPVRFVWNLARVLWRDVVKPRLSHVSTWPVEIAKRTIDTYGRAGAELSRAKHQLLREGEIIATLPAMSSKELSRIQDALEALGSLDMAKTLPWLVRKGWEQQGQPNDADIVIPGGLEGFAKEALKIKGNDGSKRVLSVLDAGQYFRKEWPGGFTISGLWTYEYIPAKGRRPSYLCITLANVLRPHAQIGKSIEPWLAPIIDPPSFVGRERDFAAQAFFANRLLIALVDHRLELLDGGALLDPKYLQRWAREVGLPQPTLWKALDSWKGEFLDIEGDPQEGARFQLADNGPYKAARNFLLKGAESTQQAKESAKKSKAAKNRRIYRTRTTKG